MDKYLAPAHQQQFELEIKRSRFITTIGNVCDKPSAKTFIQSVRDTYPDANHHCWAMVAGQPNDIYLHDQSDDGEPKGTAGKPMLNVLLHSGFGNSAIVVTRYFGGIKLGAGGLVRAYSQAVSGVIGELLTTEVYVTNRWVVKVPYSLLATLEHRLLDTNIRVGEKQFHDQIIMELHVPDSASNGLHAMLSDVGNGSILIMEEPKP